jgi:putative peptide zinc metalloprotease protein
VSTGAPATVGGLRPESVIRFHPLRVRTSDDDPDDVVVGRPDTGEFVELPAIGAEAIELLDSGVPLGEVEQRIAERHGVLLDLVDLVESLRDSGLVAIVDGRAVDDPRPARRAHLPWLADRHVRWLFGTPAKLGYALLILATLVTMINQPDLVPSHRDFFWTEYVGLAVFVNTMMLSVAASLHEISHLVAARSLGAPGRIGFATRLHHLVLQTDVTGIWAVPRRYRYRAYLSGMLCDLAVVCVSILLIAHSPLAPLAKQLLAALVLVMVLSMAVQFQVYMRTDIYFVLIELLRCRNLFHDGLAYARHLLRRAGHAAVPHRVAAAGADPSAALPPRERRAVRLYSVAVVLGSTVALTSFGLYGIPILVNGVTAAVSAVVAGATHGDLLPAVDGALLLLVEGTIQVIFLVTFLRRFRRPR